jgi:predicted ATPase
VVPGRSPTGSPRSKAIDHSERTEERWLIAEFLRVKGELLRLQAAARAAAAAEDHFRQALDWGRRQGALSWELRAATSLALLWRIRAVPRRRWRSSSRSTAASPKGSRPPI